MGIGLFLTHLVQSGLGCRALRDTYPNFFMVKDKMPLPDADVDAALNALKEEHSNAEVNDVDGVKFDLDEGCTCARATPSPSFESMPKLLHPRRHRVWRIDLLRDWVIT